MRLPPRRAEQPHAQSADDLPRRAGAGDSRCCFSLLKGKFDSFASYNIEAEALAYPSLQPCYRVLMLRAFNRYRYPPADYVRHLCEGVLRGDDSTWQFRELFEHSMFVCLVGMEADENRSWRICRRLLDISSENTPCSPSACPTATPTWRTSPPPVLKPHASRQGALLIRGQHQLISITTDAHPDVPSLRPPSPLNDLPPTDPCSSRCRPSAASSTG